MKIEELEQLKQKLSQLSEEEKKQRDLYLRDVALGNVEGQMTGYPSIDKPWNRFFDIDKLYEIKAEAPKTAYQSVYDNNKDFTKDNAIMFLGSNISYRKLLDNIDKAAKSLTEYGIKKGDFVTICCAGIPELIYTFYALAKIGAVANLMAPYFDQNDMANRINDCESETLIVMDSFYDQIKDSIRKSGIKKIIVIPTLNSSLLRFLPNKSKIKLNYKNEVIWNQFIKDGKKTIDPKIFKYEHKYPLCMVYSSGTTGASKAIVLSHDSFQNSVLSYKANTLDLKRGQRLYQIIPPWYSTGLNSCIHLPLFTGMTVFQDPRFKREIFVDNIIKYKLDFAIAPTSMYEGFLDPKITKGRKLSKFDFPFEGGEALRPDIKEKIEKQFKNMGCNSSLHVGYGQCECGAQVTTQSQNVNHPEGSVGLPIPGVSIGIFDDNFNELKYNQRGNILVDTPCGMTEYYKNPTATNKYFYTDSAGTKWSCTGDIGYIGETGDLFIEGRAEDFTMVNNIKVYNFDVERVIARDEEIKNCDVIGRPNDFGSKDLGVHLVLNENISDYYQNNKSALQEKCKIIQKMIYEEYNDYNMIPEYFKIRDNFPYKPSGKRDIEALGKEIDGFIFVDKSYFKGKELKIKLSK